jgi:hypothetical protein
MARIGVALLALGCSWLAGARAQDTGPPRPPEPTPDLDFLEYLGAWAEEDDEWLAIEEFRKDIGAAPDDDTEEFESERDDDDESE